MRSKIKLIINIALIFSASSALAGYSYYETRSLLKGPQITIESPRNGTTAENAELEISGGAKNVVALSIDGRPIFMDSDGKFKEKLILAEGYNTIFIQARDRFGETAEKTLELELSGN